MNKPKARLTPDQLFNEATEDNELSSGDLRLLTSGLTALRKEQAKPLNKIELQAVTGMIAYVGYTQEVSEETVCAILTANYGVSEVKDIPSRLYQDVIEYLVDLQMDKIVN